MGRRNAVNRFLWRPVSKYDLALKDPTFETSQTGHPWNRICQVVASQNFVSEDVVAYCDTVLITK